MRTYRAVQAVSRRLPTAAARVRAHVTSCGICCVQRDTGAGFSKYFEFSCQSFFRLLHTHHHPSGAGTIGQTDADVSSWLIQPTPNTNYTGIFVPQGCTNEVWRRLVLIGEGIQKDFCQCSDRLRAGTTVDSSSSSWRLALGSTRPCNQWVQTVYESWIFVLLSINVTHSLLIFY
jgi:hypothetical protein